MMNMIDLAIVGAGPAGMQAAVIASGQRLSVRVLDEQAFPGGQIWRGIERRSRDSSLRILGSSYLDGLAVVRAFRAAGCDYRPLTQVWNIEKLENGYRLYLKCDGKLSLCDARQVLVATGAQERPVPFPGWTLPGVLPVGAAQIQLKGSLQIPDEPVWIVGSGPLPLYYMVQLLEAGGKIAGFIDTTPQGRVLAHWRDLATGIAAGGAGAVAKGLAWQLKLRRAGVAIHHACRIISANGTTRLEGFTYEADGARTDVTASLLLTHEGLVPVPHIPLSLDCAMEWDDVGQYFRPRLDAWGETSCPGLFIAGDGARIGGSEVALIQGERCAMSISARLHGQGLPDDHRQRARLKRAAALRPFLEGVYAPAPGALVPADETNVCRCEEVTAGQIRQAAGDGPVGPNQAKAFTRCGMGPCQGRQCGHILNRILAEQEHRSPAEVGFHRIRPPLKPITLGELASLEEPSGEAPQ